MKNVIHQIDNKNECLLLPASFRAKFGLAFVLTPRKRFFVLTRFHFKANRKSIGSSKKLLGIFKIALRLRHRHVFMRQSVEILNVFNTLTFKQIFWKVKTFPKNLEYRFLFESTKISNTSFPCKNAKSKANVKTNRMVTTKCTYHKERSFASNYFFFF